MTRTSNPCAVVLAFAAIAASGTAMAANTITFSGEVTSYDYAVQYVSEAATVTPGPVLGAVTYTLRYE